MKRPGSRPQRLPTHSLRFQEQRTKQANPCCGWLAFDQFEELFSSYPQRWQDRAEFFNQVAEALRRDSFLRVLFVLREDYLAAFIEFVGLLPDNARTRYSSRAPARA